MAKAKRSRRRGSRFEIPLAIVAGLGIGLAEPIRQVTMGYPGAAMNTVAYTYVAYNPWKKKFDMSGLGRGLVPLLLGIALHKVVGQKMGFNRMLAQSGIPLLRL